ncbi:hypothetical protein Nepgr_000475 [Nepenthes gracilis]|uniref:Uncharacterized protein n=1 Tax=Nepenthes gracilis TaxID=150966 RepID=A0AAD3P372_NEPGR|nr:hypothetical protein Nepgr_000475 [Nepenthes gracilis]
MLCRGQEDKIGIDAWTKVGAKSRLTLQQVLVFFIFFAYKYLSCPQLSSVCSSSPLAKTMARSPCCDKNGVKKGPWTPEEDDKLVKYIQTHGPGNWRCLPEKAGLQRCGKSCRLRWSNYLRPDIRRGRFSFEEEETIIQLHSILGNKWSAIAASLPGRTDNEIKNHWNTHIRKRLLQMGIDPVTHSPRLDMAHYLSAIMGCFSHINLSDLLGLPALLNPELPSLLAIISSSLNKENPEVNQIPEFQSDNQFQGLSNQITHAMQATPDQKIGDLGLFNLLNSMNFCFQTDPTLEYSAPSKFSEPLDNNELPKNHWDPLMIGSNNQNLGFGLSGSTPLWGPTDALNSSSSFINSSSMSTEEERESYCSSMMKFEIPEGSLNISDLLPY